MNFFKRYLTRILQLNSIHRQSVISLFSKISLTIFGFISTMYITHIAGPSIYGDFSIFVAYLGVFLLITDGGFGGAVVKRLSEGHDQNKYFTAYMSLVISFVSIVVIILILGNQIISTYIPPNIIFWLIIGLVLSILSSYAVNGIYGIGKVGIYQSARVLSDGTRIFLQIIAVFLGFGVGGLIGAYLLGTFVGCLFNLPFLELHLEKYDMDHLKNLFNFAFWIFLGSIGSSVFGYADTIIIGLYMQPADVGIYRIAFQLTAFATFITAALQSVLYPKISYWHANGQISLIEKSISRSITYGLFFAIPVCVGGWLLGDKMLFYFYGASFETGYYALIILFLVQIANVFMFQIVSALSAINRPKDNFKSTSIASVINIGLNLLLIPVIGIIGAAVATLFTMTINSILGGYFLKKEVSLDIERKAIMSIILCSLVMGIFVFLFRYFIGLSNSILLITVIAISGIIYLLLIFRLDHEIHNDIKDLATQFGIPWPKWL